MYRKHYFIQFSGAKRMCFEQGMVSAPNSCSFDWESFHMKLRYLHLKILLLRPALIKIGRQLGSRTQSNLESTASIRSHPPISELVLSLYSACAVECVKNACELISSIQRATCENATGAWWYSIFCMNWPKIALLLMHETFKLMWQ